MDSAPAFAGLETLRLMFSGQRPFAVVRERVARQCAGDKCAHSQRPGTWFLSFSAYLIIYRPDKARFRPLSRSKCSTAKLSFPNPQFGMIGITRAISAF